MSDISNIKLLYLKAALFVLTGLLASALLLAVLPSLRNAALLAVALWSFCRAYYFAFYVIQHYADREYRFAGLFDFCMYLLRKRKNTADRQS